jgi:hypothetical protein
VCKCIWSCRSFRAGTFFNEENWNTKKFPQKEVQKAREKIYIYIHTHARTRARTSEKGPGSFCTSSSFCSGRSRVGEREREKEVNLGDFSYSSVILVLNTNKREASRDDGESGG